MLAVVAFTRALLALVLVASGAAKLAAPQEFSQTLRGLLAGSKRVGAPAALVVAACELGLGLAALLRFWLTPVDVAVVALLFAFCAITVFAIARRPDLTCRCFGALTESRFGRRTLLRNLVLLGAAIAVAVADLNLGAQPGASGWLQGLLVVTALLFAGGCAQAARTIGMLRERLVT